MADPGDETALDDGPAPLDDDEHQDDEHVMTPDMGKGIMRRWLDRYQPAPVPGVTDSLSNGPAPRRTGQLASGHPASRTTPDGDPHDPGHSLDVHSWNQVTRPAPFAGLATAGGSGPLASSIECHQGRATLAVMDQAAAANASLSGQLRAAPSGNPHMRPAPRPAPSGQGSMHRPAGAPYRLAPGE